MKKLFLAVSTLITLTAKSQTSVYHPLPDSNAVWNVHFGLYCWASGTADENYSITISGDTSISNLAYHKLFTPYIESFSTGTCGGKPIGYKGAIRQDIANKKVYFVLPSDSVEQVLYDFNMQVGDTVKGFIGSFAFPPDTVYSIDSVLVGNDYRKRWNINPCYYISFIEGIGSTYGLIEPSPGCITDMADYSLTCFSQNSVILYPDTTTNCELITNVKYIAPEKLVMRVSPNPFHLSAYLQISPEFEGAEMKIYNNLGLLQREEKISNKNSLILNRDGMINGIYLIQLLNNKGQMIVAKFVVE